MNSERLLYLLEKFRLQTLTDSERIEFDNWYQSLDVSGKQFEWPGAGQQGLVDEMLLEFRQHYLQPAPVVPMRKQKIWKYIAAAAAVILALMVGIFLFRNPKPPKKLTATDNREKRFKNDVEPGKHKAMLTLADGKKVILDQTQGVIGGGESTITNQGGELSYQAVDSRTEELVYNTVSTARGETYSIRLSDGTKVWLNSGSSIRFPMNFPSAERTVLITGEAYFEVAKDAARPFRVKKPDDDFETEVLGTHFDVKAYEDEDALRVTLMEGSVRLHKGKNEVTLKPGQQAGVINSAIRVKDNIDLEQVMAWKNGLFYFRNTDIKEIMREAARWYDLDVEYNGIPSTDGFNGRLTRDTKLSELLKILELNGVRFILEGKKIKVVS